MINRDEIQPVIMPDSMPPTMSIVVDTEEEFDWQAPLSREETATSSIQEQYRAQEIFAKYNAVPTYVIDYCVASQERSARVMADMYQQGICDVGAHLHPWINPPHIEEVTRYNSYHGNLPRQLERDKIERLTAKIAEATGKRPTVFKAGRHGVGPHTAGIIEELGYQIDCSVIPYTDLTPRGGPDFWGLPDQPYWFGKNPGMLELPLSKGFCGLGKSLGPCLRHFVETSWSERLHLRGVLARLNILDLVTMTPEGIEKGELLSLLKNQAAFGIRYFSLTYHSSSLGIGNTSYVRTEEDRRTLLDKIDLILDVFTNEMGGQIVRAQDIHDQLLVSRKAA